ncbi:hypothetical protein diail_1251 [Diaporthe ilicicola]|nr:hypothetical protein diail_1251 [Diaporthe ilicicola]
MGEPVESTIQAPPAAPPLSLLVNKKTLDASRTGILFLAVAFLFLASQICLLIWIFKKRPPAALSSKKEQRKLAIILPGETTPLCPTNIDTTDDSNGACIGTGTGIGDHSDLHLRRSSTWGGRSADQGSRHPRGRRRSASLWQMADDEDDDSSEGEGAQTTLSSPGPEPDAGRGGARGDEYMAPALLLPLGDGPQDTELRRLDSRRASGEGLVLMAASILKPWSPRSPRVLAAEQAAMMDALCAEDEGEAAGAAVAPSPVSDEGDAAALASGFDDPLGVNRRVASPLRDEEGIEGIELELRDVAQHNVLD